MYPQKFVFTLKNIDGAVFQRHTKSCHLNPDLLRKRGNRYADNQPRNYLIYLAAEYCCYENKYIAEALGNLSVNGVRQIKRIIKERLKNNRSLALEFYLLKEACGLTHQFHI